MKNSVVLLLTLVLLGCNQQEADVYLFSFFKGNGEDGLHLAASRDGFSWEALNNNQSFLKPQVGKDKLMRDPCIIKGGDGKFHMVWTVSWEEKGIGYANSSDLINWSDQKFIPVMEHEETTKNSWAPEIFYDQEQKQYIIFWASTVTNKFSETENQAEESWNHRIYYTTTDDFEVFSETEIFVEPGFNVIDATISQNGSDYFMIIKDETLLPEAKKSLHILFSNDLYNWDVAISEPISKSWVEGPTISKIEDNWVVYFDQYKEQRFGAIMSKNLKDWEDISNEVVFPEGIRHGTVFKVSKDVLSKLNSL